MGRTSFARKEAIVVKGEVPDNAEKEQKSDEIQEFCIRRLHDVWSTCRFLRTSELCRFQLSER